MINAIAIDDEPLALTVIESLCQKNDKINLLKSFTQPNVALKYLRKYPVDLILCDIQMPSLTGLSLVKALEQETMVIFTTAFSAYAVASYDLSAIDYLLKPINQKRFDAAVAKAHEYHNYLHAKEYSEDKYIFVRADYSLVKIATSDIMFIEGLADYIKIHVENRKTVIVRMTMKEILGKLPANEFVRVHRSFILPIRKIESVKNTVLVSDGREFPIGRTYAEDFMNRYADGDN